MPRPLACLLAIAPTLLVGCGESGSEATRSYPEPKSYTTEGTVKVMPAPDSPASELMIAHEEIPDFVDQAGEATSMRAMTMPFPNIAEDVSLDGLEVGDRVSLTFYVDYSADPTYIVTELVEIPIESTDPETESDG